MAKKWIEGRLGYNHENDRYGLLVSDLWKCSGLYCGQPLQIQINGKWIDTHMEMDMGNWYLYGTDLKGEDMEYLKARLEE